jgi:hypothetical protein
MLAVVIVIWTERKSPCAKAKLCVVSKHVLAAPVIEHVTGSAVEPSKKVNVTVAVDGAVPRVTPKALMTPAAPVATETTGTEELVVVDGARVPPTIGK